MQSIGLRTMDPEETLHYILIGLNIVASRITEQIAEIEYLLRSGKQPKAAGKAKRAIKTAEVVEKRKKRKLSAAGRQAISEAQKKRWLAKRAAA